MNDSHFGNVEKQYLLPLGIAQLPISLSISLSVIKVFLFVVYKKFNQMLFLYIRQNHFALKCHCYMYKTCIKPAGAAWEKQDYTKQTRYALVYIVPALYKNVT